MASTKLSSIKKPAMEVALKAAGLAPPSQMQQIWLWLKDHPRSLATDIQSTVNIPAPSCSSVIAQLRNRKMITGRKEWCEPSQREMTYYTAVGKTYEILPDLRPLEGRRHVTNRRSKAMPVVEVETPVAPVRPTSDSLLDSLSVREARELYLKLKEMFAG